MSVSCKPVACLHLWRSSRYLRISPLHLEFQAPLPTSSPVVCRAVPRLSRGISRDTYRAAYTRFKPNDSEQRLPPLSYRGCWHRVSRGFFWVCSTLRIVHPYYRGCWHGFSRGFFWDRSAGAVLARFTFISLKGVYIPKDFVLHAASLRQACAHCGRFSTAASRRSLGCVSVPVRPTTL